MTSQTDFVSPPRIALWLVSLFTPPEEAESILGDLIEEFSLLALKSGVALARKWYWRQSVKTVAHLVGTAFRVAPWTTTAAVVGGFLLRILVSGLPERAIFAVIERYQVFEHHFNTYLFFASTGIDIGQTIVFSFVGCVVALVARGREMAATVTLSLIFGSMALAGSVVMVARTGDAALLWRLTWYLADSVAIVVSGVFVRMRRDVTNLHSAT